MTKKIQVYGRVQGVFFRASTKEKADELGIKGWVRNESNGSVLIHAEGEELPMEEFINWCHKGPLMSKVEKVEIEIPESEAPQDFRITY